MGARAMEYDELKAHVEARRTRMTREDVLWWLVGYQGRVEEEDLENIERLCTARVIDK